MTQLATKLKKGDTVVVTTGKDAGKTGTISRVVTKTGKVIVSNINMVKKHVSQREAFRLQRDPGIMMKEMPIAVSNVMLADPKDGKPTRVGYKFDENGQKVRFAKRSGMTIDTVKKAK